jgi:Short C-terminal domain
MPLMRRRPLLRAAAVGGGAYMAGKSRARSQEREYDQEQRLGQLESQQPAAAPVAAPAPAPAAPPGPTEDTIERLKQLGQLHEQGVLTDAEFQSQKALLLGG